MDDRDLEARLRTRLHARFDDVAVPSELATNSQQAFAAAPTRVGFDLRSRGWWLGWSAVAATVAFAVVTVALGTLVIGGQGSRPTPSPAPSIASDRDFIVLAPAGLPSKPESSLAEDVLAARLRALGIGNFTGGIGYAITFSVPADGPSSSDIRLVLGATGDVQFVPLPPADYGDAGLVAEAGKPLPKREPSLFGWEGIESVAMDSANGRPALTITLKSAAKAAFADYTAAHVRETFAVVLDGEVALLPIINEPISSGQIQLSGGGFDDGAFARTAAILVGGMLPEAWRGAVVPGIDGKDLAVWRASNWVPMATVKSADLDAIPDGAGWRAVWMVVVTADPGDYATLCKTPWLEASPCLVTADSARLVLDAEFGNLVAFEAPPLPLP